MVIKSVELETICGITSKLPENEKPEVAFAGKSNVGKSSLINGLMNRKALAHTSSQPGKTQTINYYNINQKMYFVDLPGYGYAKVPVREKEKWGKMIENYLHTSRQLKAVFLLIDIRHEPSANDRQMYEWIVYNGFDPIIIATKQDKVNRSQLKKHIKMIRDGLHLKPGTYVFPYSALTKQGRDEIWAFIDRMLGFEEQPMESGKIPPAGQVGGENFLQEEEGNAAQEEGGSMQRGETGLSGCGNDRDNGGQGTLSGNGRDNLARQQGKRDAVLGEPSGNGKDNLAGQLGEGSTVMGTLSGNGKENLAPARKPRRKAADLPKKLRKKKEQRQSEAAGKKKKKNHAKTGGKHGKK